MSKLINYIDTIHSSHIENAQSIYQRKNVLKRSFLYDYNNNRVELSSFIYEFFIFNSLYQIDWKQSYLHQKIKYLDRKNLTELAQQRVFLSYIKQSWCDQQLTRVFQIFKYLRQIEGEWTKIMPDDRITIEKGEKFFNRIKDLQKTISSGKNITANNKSFKMIKELLCFITEVRNNVFHGSKTLEQAREINQSARIEVYEIILRAVNSLFFLVIGCKRKIASDICQFSLHHEDYIFVNKYILQESMHQLYMKPNDIRFIKDYLSCFPNLSKECSGGDMFYPSSGSDFLTPLLLSINYCDKFYFYDKSTRILRNHAFIKTLKKIFDLNEVKRDLISNKMVLSFKYKSRTKEIYFVCSDNTDVFKEDLQLGFYFHRGDSMGEGGSDQNWDSKLIEPLFEKALSKVYFVTDGKPYGIGESIKKSVTRTYPLKNFNFRPDDKYYFGVLSE